MYNVKATPPGEIQWGLVMMLMGRRENNANLYKGIAPSSFP